MNFQVTKITQFIIVVLLFAFSGIATADEVKDLYTGKILVTDKSQATRVKAHRWAIEQVLTKVTGSRDILENKTVQYEVRAKTANYIKSFTFDTDAQNRTFLIDKFDQTKIDQLIRNVGAAIWGQRRPKVAIWLVVEEGMNRRIVNSSDYPQISEVILQSAENRGLPSVIPNMDETDQQAVFTSDIWAKFDGVVNNATARYNAEYFVMARLRAVDNFKEPEYKSGWLVDYSLFKGRQFLDKSTFNGEQFFVLKEMVNKVGDYFASQYAINNQKIQQQNIEFTINNLNSMIDLKKVENYLMELPPVKKVYLHEVNADQARFTLWLSGQGLDVIKGLSLLPNFQREQSPNAVEKVALSVEQQLEQLTKEYTDQNSNDGSLEKVNSQITELYYRWVAN
ncbi:DUF2066 domain-containing protein [Psychrosphaera aestuarii]|uniref:DUF2066 domain-containing protein n=1 Tax=Psychrosphaera aestuarii TaxID=1266052 RepID=UPI001B345623|nr:DUF2066 domain-containing protein [Psychrosphaera aestuarii]